MSHANTTLAAPATMPIEGDGACLDCEDAISEGYGGCGDCLAPDEPWEYTTPSDVWEV